MDTSELIEHIRAIEEYAKSQNATSCDVARILSSQGLALVSHIGNLREISLRDATTLSSTVRTSIFEPDTQALVLRAIDDRVIETTKVSTSSAKGVQRTQQHCESYPYFLIDEDWKKLDIGGLSANVAVVSVRAAKWGMRCPCESLSGIMAATACAGHKVYNPDAATLKSLKEKIHNAIKDIDAKSKYPFNHRARFPLRPSEMSPEEITFAVGHPGLLMPAVDKEMLDAIMHIKSGPKYLRNTATELKAIPVRDALPQQQVPRSPMDFTNMMGGMANPMFAEFLQWQQMQQMQQMQGYMFSGLHSQPNAQFGSWKPAVTGMLENGSAHTPGQSAQTGAQNQQSRAAAGDVKSMLRWRPRAAGDASAAGNAAPAAGSDADVVETEGAPTEQAETNIDKKDKEDKGKKDTSAPLASENDPLASLKRSMEINESARKEAKEVETEEKKKAKRLNQMKVMAAASAVTSDSSGTQPSGASTVPAPPWRKPASTVPAPTWRKPANGTRKRPAATAASSEAPIPARPPFPASSEAPIPAATAASSNVDTFLTEDAMKNRTKDAFTTRAYKAVRKMTHSTAEARKAYAKAVAAWDKVHS